MTEGGSAMIMVTGGLGFIGSHTVQALLDAGEECVVVQRSATEIPAGRFTAPVALERLDTGDLDALRAVGDRHEVTGIVHLAGSFPWPPSDEAPADAARRSLGSLLNIVSVAQEWGVARLGLASTIGVYARAGVEGPLTEDRPTTLTAPHVIPRFKKISELLADHFSQVTDLELVNLRISGTWGPLGHPDPFFAAPELVHAAADGRAPDLSGLARPAHAEDALDLLYVRDTGRAIASLQLAERLAHRTYNVASGRATSNAEVSAALRQVVPDAEVELPTGGDARANWLDIARLREDTGFAPEYDTERAAADYVAWLRDGHEW